MASSGNGLNGPENRLDRIERLLMRSIEENQAAHEAFEERNKAFEERNKAFEDRNRLFEKRFEHVGDDLDSLKEYRRILLSAQVLHQDRMDHSDEMMKRVERNLAEATDKLNALIHFVDRHVHEPHPPPEQQQ